MNERATSFYKQIGYVLIAVFFIRCYISKDTLFQNFAFYELIGCIGDAITITSILMIVYEKFLWKFNRFETVPKLKGHYTGTILSTYDNKCRNATMDIRQTLLTAHIKLKTDESTSLSVNASIINLHGENCLIYTYLNTPHALVRKDSSIHYGTATLCLENNSLEGDYYTDRKTTGTMNFKAITKK